MESTAVIAATSILALAATIPWSRRLWQPIGPLGCAAAPLALVLTLVVIWTRADLSELFNKTCRISWVLAVGLPLVGLLALARLRRPYVVVRLATVSAITLLGVQVIATIIVEPGMDWWVRIMGVLAIFSASGIIAVPILHRLSGIPDNPLAVEISDRLKLTCPHCESPQELPLGRSTCTECGLQFRIEVSQ